MRVRRPWMSCAQRNELWTRWRAGESLTDIAKALERGTARVHEIVVAEGGIAPAAARRDRVAVAGGGAATGAVGAHRVRSRGDFTRPRQWRLGAGAGPTTRTGAVNDQSRDSAPRRTSVLSSAASRPARVGAESSAEAVSPLLAAGI